MHCLTQENKSWVSDFLLSGFSDYPEYRVVIIILFLLLYILSLVGNIFIITVTNLFPQLHTPMYFFISNLSFVDLCLTSVTVPKYLGNLLSNDQSISFQGCLFQMFMFIWLASIEAFLVAVMSYDRYVAICNPLNYILVMTKRFCVVLLTLSCILTFLHCSVHMALIFRLCFCGPNTIKGFFCDHPPVLELSCSDTSINHLVLNSEGFFVAGVPFFVILGAYTCIITSILRLPSALKRQKAFLTCSSHLTVIVLLFGTGGSMYFLPSSVIQKGNKIYGTLMYALVAPMMNPYIYSLRNKDIKGALKKVLRVNSFQ